MTLASVSKNGPDTGGGTNPLPYSHSLGLTPLACDSLTVLPSTAPQLSYFMDSSSSGSELDFEQSSAETEEDRDADEIFLGRGNRDTILNDRDNANINIATNQSKLQIPATTVPETLNSNSNKVLIKFNCKDDEEGNSNCLNKDRELKLTDSKVGKEQREKRAFDDELKVLPHQQQQRQQKEEVVEVVLIGSAEQEEGRRWQGGSSSSATTSSGSGSSGSVGAGGGTAVVLACHSRSSDKNNNIKAKIIPEISCLKKEFLFSSDNNYGCRDPEGCAKLGLNNNKNCSRCSVQELDQGNNICDISSCLDEAYDASDASGDAAEDDTALQIIDDSLMQHKSGGDPPIHPSFVLSGTTNSSAPGRSISHRPAGNMASTTANNPHQHQQHILRSVLKRHGQRSRGHRVSFNETRNQFMEPDYVILFQGDCEPQLVSIRSLELGLPPPPAPPVLEGITLSPPDGYKDCFNRVLREMIPQDKGETKENNM